MANGAPPITVEQERDRLLSFTRADLAIIAEELGAPIGKTKSDLALNILAKKLGQSPDEVEAAIGRGAEMEDEEEEAEVVEPEEDEGEEQEEAVIEEGPRPMLVKHLMLTMLDRDNEGEGVLSDAKVNMRVEEWFAKGYDPVEFQPIGFGQNGHRLFWVFQKTDSPKYKRALHIMRLLTPVPQVARNTMSGPMADAYISAFIDQGWKLLAAKTNGLDLSGQDVSGVYMIWMLVK